MDAAQEQGSKQGYLLKRGEKNKFSYKKRWFQTQRDGKLYYFKTHADLSQPVGHIPMRDATVRRFTTSSKAKAHGIEVITEKRVWQLFAETEEEQAEWLAFLSNWMQTDSNIYLQQAEDIVLAITEALCEAALDEISEGVQFPTTVFDSPLRCELAVPSEVDANARHVAQARDTLLRRSTLREGSQSIFPESMPADAPMKTSNARSNFGDVSDLGQDDVSAVSVSPSPTNAFAEQNALEDAEPPRTMNALKRRHKLNKAERHLSQAHSTIAPNVGDAGNDQPLASTAGMRVSQTPTGPRRSLGRSFSNALPSILNNAKKNQFYHVQQYAQQQERHHHHQQQQQQQQQQQHQQQQQERFAQSHQSDNFSVAEAHVEQARHAHNVSVADDDDDDGAAHPATKERRAQGQSCIIDNNVHQWTRASDAAVTVGEKDALASEFDRYNQTRRKRASTLRGIASPMDVFLHPKSLGLDATSQTPGAAKARLPSREAPCLPAAQQHRHSSTSGAEDADKEKPHARHALGDEHHRRAQTIAISSPANGPRPLSVCESTSSSSSTNSPVAALHSIREARRVAAAEEASSMLEGHVRAMHPDASVAPEPDGECVIAIAPSRRAAGIDTRQLARDVTSSIRRRKKASKDSCGVAGMVAKRSKMCEAVPADAPTVALKGTVSPASVLAASNTVIPSTRSSGVTEQMMGATIPIALDIDDIARELLLLGASDDDDDDDYDDDFGDNYDNDELGASRDDDVYAIGEAVAFGATFVDGKGSLSNHEVRESVAVNGELVAFQKFRGSEEGIESNAEGNAEGNAEAPVRPGDSAHAFMDSDGSSHDLPHPEHHHHPHARAFSHEQRQQWPREEGALVHTAEKRTQIAPLLETPGSSLVPDARVRDANVIVIDGGSLLVYSDNDDDDDDSASDLDVGAPSNIASLLASIGSMSDPSMLGADDVAVHDTTSMNGPPSRQVWSSGLASPHGFYDHLLVEGDEANDFMRAPTQQDLVQLTSFSSDHQPSNHDEAWRACQEHDSVASPGESATHLSSRVQSSIASLPNGPHSQSARTSVLPHVHVEDERDDVQLHGRADLLWRSYRRSNKALTKKGHQLRSHPIRAEAARNGRGNAENHLNTADEGSVTQITDETMDVRLSHSTSNA